MIALSSRSSGVGRRGRGVVSVIVVTVMVTALLATAGVASGSTRAATKGSTGGELSVGTPFALTTLDPAGTAVVDSGTFGALYGVLIYRDAKTGKYVGQMAQGISPNADSTVWTLKLRPGVTFTDGTPYDAAAVVTNIQREMSSKGIQGPAHGLLTTFVKSVVAQDPQTVVFTLTRPLATFDYIMAYFPTYIAAPSYLAKVDAGDSNATPIGAGPFKFDEFRANELTRLVRNDAYFAGAPKLDAVKFVYLSGGPATLQTVQTNGADMGYIIDAVSAADLRAAKLPHASVPTNMANTVLINNRPKDQSGGSVLSDVRLRKALAYAFNSTFYNQHTNQGKGSNTNMLFPPGSQWYSPKMQGPAYNLQKAKQLVSQVKKDTGWDGTIGYTCTNTPENADLPTTMKAMLEPAGFKLNVNNSLTLGQFIVSVIVSPSYDLACWGVSVPDSAPAAILYTAFLSTSPNNWGKYSSPEMDAALDQLTAANTSSAVQAALAKFVKIWNATIPSLNVSSSHDTLFWNADVKGVKVSGDRPFPVNWDKISKS